MTADRFPPELIREVRARTDLVRLAERATRLRRAGARFVGLCPFHRERTPSFHVVPDRGFYHCFGCGAHGGAIDFVMATENRPFRETVEVLAERAGVSLPGAPAPPRRKAPVVARPVAVEEVRGRRRAERERAYEMWRRRTPFAGSLAESYLVEARRVGGPWLRACPALGFAPRLGYWIQNAPSSARGFGGHSGKPELIWEGPALLAAMQFPDGRFAAVHCTYLQPDGAGTLVLYERAGVKRSAKKVRGTPGGAAIRLTPAAPAMVVGEGIETTASAFRASRVFWGGQAPAGWAAYSLDNLAGAGIAPGPRNPSDRRRRLAPEVPDMSRPGLQLPRDCRRVTYLGDGDTADAAMLEQKLKRAVRRALQLGLAADYVVTPPGTDLNDVLRTEAA